MRTERAAELRRQLSEIEAKEHLSVADVAAVNEISSEIADGAAERARRSQVDDLGAPSHIAGHTYPTTLGEALVRSAEYQAASAAIRDAESPRFSHTIEVKVAGDPILESGGSNDAAVPPNWIPTVYAPGLVAFPVRIQAVLNTRQLATGNSAQWPVATTRSMEDQTSTAESENKAGAEFAFDVETATVEKWTAFSAMSEEFFTDAPSIAAYVNEQLLAMALEKEETAIAQVLYTAATQAADGTGIGGIEGYDAVLEAMTIIRVAGGNPTAILINPTDWSRLAVTRSVAGDGGYFSGGPYSAPAQGLWGTLREVQTPRVPEGTALVGDFASGCTLFRRGGPRLETSNSHEDFFRRNLVALRGEVRSVIGVHNPEHFVEVEIGS